MAGSGEISQIYRSGPASARKDPSSIPNVSEAIASLNSTPEANSPREKRRCFFAPVFAEAREREREIGGVVVVRCEGERERLGEISRRRLGFPVVLWWLHLENVVGEEDFRG
ncbi:uncharacterized protein HKW66_Vig0083050 [Vigna angularis]|uniref:Uncharacterized protein n=1 Tax=Phaseolus angularis TaxID=3914 RepID=A0A8T0KLF6_PHAAN|nr:uncharacterized protein HKW66_Vig0083050 [Vigna angularis]